MDKDKLTDEFLETLLEVAKEMGNSIDYPATQEFVRECYILAEKSPPTKDEFRIDCR